MSDVTLIPSAEQRKERARARARKVLGESEGFKSLTLAEQQDLYLSVVQEYMDADAAQHGLPVSRPLATDDGKAMGFKGYDPAFGGTTQGFDELVETVDFPKFVKDLLKAVFDANLSVMKSQTDSYIKLMKEASKSTSDFIKQVKDEESFMKLAETKGDMYNVAIAEEAGKKTISLTNPQGDVVAKADPKTGIADTDDDEIKRHILEAKINMAKEHRAALREVLLMGVTRLVVNKGLIEAGVEFTVKGQRKSDASHSDTNINNVNAQFGYEPPLFGLFGGPSGSVSVSNTNIQVNTANKNATDEMTANLKGRVQIEFKTDYFKLDNFATMYGDGGVGAVQPAAPGGAGAIPAPPRP